MMAKEDMLLQLDGPGQVLARELANLRAEVLQPLQGDYTSRSIELAHQTGKLLHFDVAPLAERLNSLINRAQTLLLKHAATKPPPSGGKRYLNRVTQRKQNQLYNKQRALKRLHTLLSSPLLPDETTESTLQGINLYLGGQSSLPPITRDLLQMPGEARELATLQVHEELNRVNKEAREWYRALERDNLNHYRLTFQRNLATKPKLAHRQIFKPDQGAMMQVDPLTAIQHPHTGITERSSQGITNAFEAFFTKLLTPANGSKTGEYLPPPGGYNFPWEQEGAPDQFRLAPQDPQAAQTAELLRDIMNVSYFRTTIQHLPNCKQAGPDGIPNETLKILPESIVAGVQDLFTIMWVLHYTPHTWKTSNTVLLYKEGKDPTKPGNYRPVGLANTILKLWTATITRALSTFAEQQQLLSTTQEGFRKARNTHRQCLNVINTIADAATFGHNLYALYVDYSSAFNTTDHDLQLQIMYATGYPVDAINVIKDLYTGTTTVIQTRHGTTPPITVNRGTIQGETLSPFLFLAYIEPLLRWLHSGDTDMAAYNMRKTSNTSTVQGRLLMMWPSSPTPCKISTFRWIS
jgi:hypothetical protein